MPRLSILQFLGAAAIIAIATAASDVGTGPSAPAPDNAPSMTQFVQGQLFHILGKDVRGAGGTVLGRVVDLLVDGQGQPRAALIDFGGFLGVGSRKIAVDWSALHFPAPTKPESPIKLELNRDQVNAAPAYEDGKPVVVLSALGKLEPLPLE